MYTTLIHTKPDAIKMVSRQTNFSHFQEKVIYEKTFKFENKNKIVFLCFEIDFEQKIGGRHKDSKYVQVRAS